MFLWQKLKRIAIHSSNHSVAAGLTLGYAVSFNPMVGTHTFWLLGMCWLFRGNFVAAMISSLVGNVWTFWAFFWVSYQVGDALTQVLGHDFIVMLKDLPLFSEKWGGDLFIITFIGWPIMVLVTFALTYYPNLMLVKRVKRAYQERKTKRLQQV